VDQDYTEISDDEPPDSASESSDSDADDPTLQQMKKQFAAMVKEMETLEQVVAASQWMASMQITENDRRKFTAFDKCAKKLDERKVW
jgi:hypothetical protein